MRPSMRSSRRGGIGGPLVFRTGMLMRTGLPLRGERPAAGVAGHVGHGELPAGGRPVPPGVPLRFLTWICMDPVQWSGAEPPLTVQRWIERDGQPLFRLPGQPPAGAGRCRRLEDELERTPSEAGPYRYVVDVRDPAGSHSAGATFEVRPEE